MIFFLYLLKAKSKRRPSSDDNDVIGNHFAAQFNVQNKTPKRKPSSASATYTPLSASLPSFNDSDDDEDDSLLNSSSKGKNAFSSQVRRKYLSSALNLLVLPL